MVSLLNLYSFFFKTQEFYTANNKPNVGVCMLYIVNAPILPLKPGGKYWVYARQISVDEVIVLLRTQEFVSAIGHEATARLLTDLLGIEIPMNRIQIQLGAGDEVIAFTLRRRLPEGKVIYSPEELEQIGYDFWLFSVSPANS